ncbi:tRNA epoxyqueuosine(34) reductase QueG [candidate division KSB1 bacterium]|nr:tRNA epoxyqueuosine(34) reductase QueG [candidate division KSB1 bacterium]
MIPAPEAKARIVEEATRLGIGRVGFAPAAPPSRHEQFRRWLAAGMAGTMTYLNRQERRRSDPRRLLPGARTIISLGESYYTGRLPAEIRNDPSRGLIAAYAWGADYHEVFWQKVRSLAGWIEDRMDGARCLSYVDRGPLAERDHAERAGFGFVGKNTMLISPRAGSLGFIGEILTTLELPAASANRMPGCGSCTRCIETCPTHAFPAEYVLDSRLCISYLTIEYRGVIPRELRSLMGNHVFGCDDCQDCCPWNERFSQFTSEPAYYSGLERKAPQLSDLAGLGEADYLERFQHTAVLRASHRMLLRNVAIALGNWRTESALEALEPLLHHPDGLVRAPAVWAAGRVNTSGSSRLLSRLRATETDPRVIAELTVPPS